MRRVLIALFNALGAMAAVYAVFELMRIIGYYWQIVTLPYPLTYLEFAFLGSVFCGLCFVFGIIFTRPGMCLGSGTAGQGCSERLKSRRDKVREVMVRCGNPWWRLS